MEDLHLEKPEPIESGKIDWDKPLYAGKYFDGIKNIIGIEKLGNFTSKFRYKETVYSVMKISYTDDSDQLFNVDDYGIMVNNTYEVVTNTPPKKEIDWTNLKFKDDMATGKLFHAILDPFAKFATDSNDDKKDSIYIVHAKIKNIPDTYTVYYNQHGQLLGDLNISIVNSYFLEKAPMIF